MMYVQEVGPGQTFKVNGQIYLCVEYEGKAGVCFGTGTMVRFAYDRLCELVELKLEIEKVPIVKTYLHLQTTEQRNLRTFGPHCPGELFKCGDLVLLKSALGAFDVATGLRVYKDGGRRLTYEVI